jgi:hypothetical protein
VATAYVAGTAYVAPRAISGQAIRAVLLASATPTTFGRLRSQPGCPDLARIVLPSEPQDGGGANHQEAPKVSVALLADLDLAFGPATAVGLRRHPSQAGRELAT